MKLKVILIIGVIMMASCAGMENDLHPEKTYSVITIDECEYIFVSRRPWGGEFSLTHKGNCKYCIERNKNGTRNNDN